MEAAAVEILRPSSPVLSPCRSTGKRRSTGTSTGAATTSDSSSPEFEFWNMQRNPSFPQPNLLSADELFSDGVLLPLHLLHTHSSDDPPDQNLPDKRREAEDFGSDQPGPGSVPEVSSVLSGLSTPAFTSSKRWKDIFKISSDRRKLADGVISGKEKEKEKKKEKKIAASGGGGGSNNGGVSAAELNIDIWPFRRSRSAGNGGSRPRMAATGASTRKVSSAPCSRSNSAGESKSRKQWPSSPSRGGVHLGRSSPVWQVRRGSAGGKVGAGDLVARNAEKVAIKRDANHETRRKTSAVTAMSSGGASGGGAKAKVLHLNVPMCIGYRNHLSCRSNENSAVSVVAGGVGGGALRLGGVSRGGGSSEEGGRGSNLFNIRSLFTKKVH